MANNLNKENADPFGQEESQNPISTLLHRYIPFWPVFVITITLSLIGAWIHLRYQTPIYDATASFLLKENKNSLDASGALNALTLSSMKRSTVDDEVELLKSRTIMMKVVEDMGLYAQIFQQGQIRDVLGYPSPVKFIATDPTLLNGSAPVLFDYYPGKRYVVIMGKKYPLDRPVVTPLGEFTIVPNPPAPGTVYPADEKQRLILILTPVKAMAKSLLGRLEVTSNSRVSNVISLRLTDQSAQRAIDILNDLIREYNRASVTDKNVMAANTLKYVDKQLEVLKNEVRKIEGNIQEFKSREKIVSVSDQGMAYLTNVQANDLKVSETKLQIDELSQIEKYISKKGSAPTIVPATGKILDPILLDQLSKLYQGDLELDRLRKTSGENSPKVEAIRGQTEMLRNGLKESLKNIHKDLTLTLNSYQGQGDKYAGLLKAVPAKEKALLDISRQLSIKNQIYDFLLQKREETALAMAAIVADSRLVDEAESNYYPIKPVPRNIYLSALLIGIAATVGFVYVREQFN